MMKSTGRNASKVSWMHNLGMQCLINILVDKTVNLYSIHWLTLSILFHSPTPFQLLLAAYTEWPTWHVHDHELTGLVTWSADLLGYPGNDSQLYNTTRIRSTLTNFLFLQNLLIWVTSLAVKCGATSLLNAMILLAITTVRNEPDV